MRFDDLQRCTRALTQLADQTRRGSRNVDAWLASGVVAYRQFDDRVAGGSLRMPAAVADIEKALQLLPGDSLLTQIAEKVNADLRAAEQQKKVAAIRAQQRADLMEAADLALLFWIDDRVQ